MQVSVGCGKDESDMSLNCYYQNTFNNIMTKTTYNIDYRDNFIKKIRITYTYRQDDQNIDGVGTGTDGTTDDTNSEENQIVDGVLGNAIDNIINDITDTILDIAQIKERHIVVQNTYGNLPGFAIQNTSDDDNNDYTVTYVINSDDMSDMDLESMNISRNFNTFKNTLVQNGYICE